jgi:outer membrane protein OmpA-like peptidoglycan-associated protein
MNILKKTVLVCIVLSRIPAFAETSFSLGLGPEVNLITLEERSLAMGGIISAEAGFGPVFAAGINIGAGYGWNDFIYIENRIFARWYFARPWRMAFFFQGDAGLLVTYRTLDQIESRGSPSGGLTLGSRIHLPGGWFLEPSVRGGWPYLFGGGIVMGYSFKSRNGYSQGAETGNLRSSEETLVYVQLGTIPEIAALSIEPYVYFGSNTADFTGLTIQTIENNYRLLREIADFLKQNPEYNLIIEGHANPVINTDNEEKTSLSPLSRKRAELVSGTLINYGINRKRLVIAGSGGTKTLVPWPEREYWQLNRRVEFMLVRPRSVGEKNEK